VRRIGFVFALLVALACVGCCAAEQRAVKDIEANHAIILPEYLELLEKSTDPKWTLERKDDRKKLVQSVKAVVESLKKSVE